MTLSRDDLLARARRIKLLVLDVDGVLTDGRIIYTSSGDLIQAFNVKDGLGIKLLQRYGIDCAVITARGGPGLERRCKELGIAHLYQGVQDKCKAVRSIMEGLGLTPSEICAVGDDWVDLPMLALAGLSITVADAMPSMFSHVHHVTSRKGGHGAVREICELILEAKGVLDESMNHYLDHSTSITCKDNK